MIVAYLTGPEWVIWTRKVSFSSINAIRGLEGIREVIKAVYNDSLRGSRLNGVNKPYTISAVSAGSNVLQELAVEVILRLVRKCRLYALITNI